MHEGTLIDTQQVYNDFNGNKRLLESQIEQLKEETELKELRSSIQTLSSQFTPELLQKLPSYDHKYYTESIDKLIELVEVKKSKLKSSSGSKRFAFKSRKPVPSEKSASQGEAQAEHQSLSFSNTPKQPDIENIIDQDNYIIDTANYPKTLYIANIKNSHVSFSAESNILHSIHLSNCTNSTIDITSQTSIFIDSLELCLFKTKSLQLRLHSVVDSSFVIEITNDLKRVVIESCNGLKLASFHENVQLQVDDFQNPNKSKINPNYQFLQSTTEREFLLSKFK